MALGAGPAADAKVGTDVLAAVAEPTQAVRQLRKEIRLLENEMGKVAKRGRAWSAVLDVQKTKLATLQQQEKYVGNIIKNDATLKRQLQTALSAGNLFKGVMTAQAIKGIVRGELPDIRSLVAFTVMSSERIRSLAEKVGGKWGARVTRWLPFVPFAGELLSVGLEQWQATKRNQEAVRKIGQQFREGKTPYAVAKLAQDVAGDFGFFNPLPMVTAVTEAGKAMATKRPSLLKNLLNEFVWDINSSNEQRGMTSAWMGQGGINQYQFKRDIKRIDETEFLGAVRDEIDKREFREGAALSDKARQDIYVQVLSDMAQRKHFPPAMIRELTDKMAKILDTTHEQSHIEKFISWEHKEREATEMRRHIIPAKLEY